MNNGSGYTASWEIVEDEITFTLSALTLGWVGIGFSFDEMMVCLLTHVAEYLNIYCISLIA